MNKERMKQIIDESWKDQETDNCIDGSEKDQFIDGVINHPEIEAMFESGEDTVIQNVNHPYCPKRKCGMRQQNKETSCMFCGTELIFPKGATK